MARPSPEAMEDERRRARQKSASESARREHLRGSTRPAADETRRGVEDFVASDRIASYPLDEGDLADEADVPTGVVAPRLWLEAEIQRAYVRVGAPNAEPEASTIAQWLLTSHDATFAVDVEHLPKHAATPARLLAHVESLGLGLSKRLAVTIARRASLLLMNADRGGPDGSEGKRQDRNPSQRGNDAALHAASAHRRGEGGGGPPHAAPAEEIPSASGMAVQDDEQARHDGAPPESLRPGDGASRQQDDGHRSARRELVALLEARYWHLFAHDEADEEARRRVRGLIVAAAAQRQKERDADACAQEPQQPDVPQGIPAERPESGSRQSEASAAPEESRQARAATDALIAFVSGGPTAAPPLEPAWRRINPRLYPQMMIDLTGSRMEVSYHGDPNKITGPSHSRTRPQQPTGPEVVGYVEVKEDMTFCEGAAYVTLQVGTIIELIRPSERDRKDLERFGKEKKPHAMVRWKGRSRCVPSRCITRTDESTWNAQHRKTAP